MKEPTNSFLTEGELFEREQSRQRRLLKKMLRYSKKTIKHDGEDITINRGLWLIDKGVLVLRTTKNRALTKCHNTFSKRPEPRKDDTTTKFEAIYNDIITVTGYPPNELSLSKVMPKYKIANYLKWMRQERRDE